jgi:hypothetical protein
MRNVGLWFSRDIMFVLFIVIISYLIILILATVRSGSVLGNIDMHNAAIWRHNFEHTRTVLLLFLKRHLLDLLIDKNIKLGQQRRQEQNENNNDNAESSYFI